MAISEKFYKCYVCNKSGDVISLVMELCGIDFLAALRRINDDFDLNLYKDKPRSISEQLADERRRRELKEKLHREEEEQAEKEKRERIERELWDKWIEYDRALRELRPKSRGEEIDERYIHALKNIKYIEHLIDEL